jgi:glutaredoxin
MKQRIGLLEGLALDFKEKEDSTLVLQQEIKVCRHEIERKNELIKHMKEKTASPVLVINAATTTCSDNSID